MLVRKMGITIVMYKRYVDDVDCLEKRVKKTMKYNPDEKQMIDTDPSNEDMMDDDEMMTLLRDIANSVTDMIKWEHDTADRHTDGQLLVLDIKLHLDHEDRDNMVKFKFYQKESSNKALVSAASSMPKGMMFSTLVEECCRRLRNTSPSIRQVEKPALMQDFNAWMMKSIHMYPLKGTQNLL